MDSHQLASQQAEHPACMGDAAVNEPPRAVVKVGGSLLDLPDLADRLAAFLASLAHLRVMLVIGGGPAAELVRHHGHDQLDEEQSHWLAVRAMSFNSFLIEALLPDSVVAANLAQCQSAWMVGRIPIVDPHSFLVSDDASGSTVLPHSWAVTSDSIAARVANACAAQELVLLKSVSWPADSDLKSAARQGVVDEHFPFEVGRSAGLRVRIVNLRD
jgi:aspartokinase-like uncharacterized kinase